MTFLRRIFRSDEDSSGPRVPAGDRAYAIGDVHGRLDLLDEILDQIESDNRQRGPARIFIVFLGDLIDRGPASREVIERVRTFRPDWAQVICLCGNHEEILLRLLRGDGDVLGDWLRFGGAECVESYGIEAKSLKRMEPSRAVCRVRNGLPDDHQAFLKALHDTFRLGDYLFVHAGVRPGIPLNEQAQGDLRWIRQPFLESADSHGFVVVHGHTISEQIDVRENRIGLDTGAYRTGVLTAIGLEGADRWFLQTGAGSGSRSGADGKRSTDRSDRLGKAAFQEGALQ